MRCREKDREAEIRDSASRRVFARGGSANTEPVVRGTHPGVVMLRSEFGLRCSVPWANRGLKECYRPVRDVLDIWSESARVRSGRVRDPHRMHGQHLPIAACADTTEDDVVDPYRRSWETYQRSAAQLVPAIDEVARVVRLAVTTA